MNQVQTHPLWRDFREPSSWAPVGNWHGFPEKQQTISQIKGALSRYSVLLCRFFCSQKWRRGSSRPRHRPTSCRHWLAWPHFFLLFKSDASQSIDAGVPVACPCKVGLLLHEVGLWELIKKLRTKRRGCPAMADVNNGKICLESKTGLHSSTDRSWAVLVRQSFKPHDIFVQLCRLHNTVQCTLR